ncbi:MAG TPA: PKD domain-containing protein [Anaeromyxobacteraceae bacterium]|nr:PKD domain-containing protein [Anaeromyxobacteraceae bacterium]
MRRILGSMAVAFALAGCGGGSSGSTTGGPPPPPPPPSSCLPTISQCTKSQECCGVCFYGYCMPSGQGGKCATSGDCQDPYTCVSGVCSTAACRQDLDVCTGDAQCCAGHCRPNGTCGANRPPVAVAGAEASVRKRQTVTLGGSSDPDGDPLTYSWSLAVPAGSAAQLSTIWPATPSFVTDLVGPYVATVTVSDGQYSATASATITAFNSPPVANAGPDQNVPRNTLAQVSGAASSDPDQDALTYAWSIAGPAGSTAALSDPTSPTPSFTPDRLGAYTLTLTVSDGNLAAADTVVVTAVNTPPVPAIGAAAAVNAGEAATASAAGSSDVNGDPLTFTWTLTAPAGSASTLTATTGLTTSFTTDVEGDYALDLAASDGIDTRTVRRTVHAYPHVTKLAHDVVAAAYSRATDRLLTISTTPVNALWILDPITEIETRVDLAGGPPLSVGVSADGLAAVVGRNGGVTHVDLVNATVLGDCVTQWTDNTTVPASTWPYDVGSVSVGPALTFTSKGTTRTTRFAYTSPGTALHHGDFALGIDLGTCSMSSDWLMQSYAFEGMSSLRPGTEQFFVFDFYSYDDFFYVYSTAGGPISRLYTNTITRTVKEDYYCYQGFWFTDDGSRFVCQSGHVYDANATLSVSNYSFPLLGSLGDLAFGASFQLVTHADHSSAQQAVSIVPKNDYGQTDADTVLKRFTVYAASPKTYPASGTPVALPTLAIDGGPYAAHGRYVFYRSDGSKRYVVTRTAPGAAATLFAIATMAP